MTVLCIIGPGGVGGLLAGLLAETVDLTVVARPETASILTRDGITIHSAQFGTRQVRPTIATEVPPGNDVIIAAKADALPALDLNDPTEVVTLLNGAAHLQAVSALAEKAYAGAIRVISERRSPGQIYHHSDFVRVDLPPEAQHSSIARALAGAGVDVRWGESQVEVTWSKLAFLAPMALATAASGSPIGPALTQVDSTALCDEVAAVARAEGYETTGSKIHAYLESIDPNATSSLARDVSAGREGELAVLGDDLVTRAHSHNCEVPVMVSLIDTIRTTLETKVRDDDGTPRNEE